MLVAETNVRCFLVHLVCMGAGLNTVRVGLTFLAPISTNIQYQRVHKPKIRSSRVYVETDSLSERLGSRPRLAVQDLGSRQVCIRLAPFIYVMASCVDWVRKEKSHVKTPTFHTPPRHYGQCQNIQTPLLVRSWHSCSRAFLARQRVR